MRAVLDSDPQSGSGYAVLTIYGADPDNMPFPVLRRVSDGKVLAEGGWKSPPGMLVPVRQESSGNTIRLFLAPAMVDNISASQHYILEVPGLGSCTLEMARLMQSDVIDLNGQDMYPPPPQSPQTPPVSEAIPPESPAFEQNAIYEGVEASPEITGTGDNASAPSGVAANPAAKSPKKGRGCLFLCLSALAVWALGAWFLWHASMGGSKKPVAEAVGEKDNAPFFEIIPSSRESSFVEDADTGKSGK